MMSLSDRISTDLTAAMKEREAAQLVALRMLKSAITNKGIEKGRDLDDGEVLQVIASLVKQRRDSIEQFSKAGRTDLVAKETAEIAVLDRYLPPPISAADIERACAILLAAEAAAWEAIRRDRIPKHPRRAAGKTEWAATGRKQSRRAATRVSRPLATASRWPFRTVARRGRACRCGRGSGR